MSARVGPDGFVWAGAKWLRRDKRLAIYSRDDGACAYCGARCVERGDATIDHVLPRARGGSNHERNLVTACLSCNASKGDSTVAQWLRKLRKGGASTAGIAAHVRRLTRRSLRAHRAVAKLMMSKHGGYTPALLAGMGVLW